ncbi:Na/Pi-cotransporter family protein [Rhodobacterales bacterium Y4I]|nr:Na/Pi-cotransporter family protein [Rhodobacterales bacterium Y4I]
MAILTFLISLAGATMLLLYAVRMVRTGIERSYGASFQRLLTGRQSHLQAGMMGLTLAIVLQSSAAVALLASGFAASGYLAFPTGLAIVLGGDLGSALIIQILSFKLDWLVPMLLAAGGYLFVKTEAKKARQLGRILMGVAFILISLRFLREAMDPIRGSAFLPAIAGYLARDYITAFLAGGALAFVMHSSVAAILMCVTLVQIGALPFAAGLSLVLGANFGSAFIPVLAQPRMDLKARRIPYANLACAALGGDLLLGPIWRCARAGSAIRRAARCWSARISPSTPRCCCWRCRSARRWPVSLRGCSRIRRCGRSRRGGRSARWSRAATARPRRRWPTSPASSCGWPGWSAPCSARCWSCTRAAARSRSARCSRWTRR